jgi:hypothetical protein
MPYIIERWGKKGIVVNSQSGKHYSSSPIPIANAEKQLNLLRAVDKGMKPTGKK